MNKQRSHLSRGFTLVELVISVCVMAIISVYMLQFFIGAKDLNRKAEDLDASVYFSSSVMESIKADVWETSDLLMAFGTPQKKSDGRAEWIAYFDSDFQPVVKVDSKALFESKLTVETLNASEKEKGLYQVIVEVKRLKPYFRGKTSEPVLFTLASKLYLKGFKEVTVK